MRHAQLVLALLALVTWWLWYPASAIPSYNQIRAGQIHASELTKPSPQRKKSSTPSGVTGAVAPFAMAYWAEGTSRHRLHVEQRSGSYDVEVPSPAPFADNRGAITEIPGQGFAYGWIRMDLGLGYVMLDRYGDAGQFHVVDENTVTYLPSGCRSWHTNNALALAAATDGRVALMWRVSGGETYGSFCHYAGSSYRNHLAIIDQWGNMVAGPISIDETGLCLTGSGCELSDPIVAATGDNRFITVWSKYESLPHPDQEVVRFQIHDSSGNPVTPPTDLLTSTSGLLNYRLSGAANVGNNRVMVTWYQWDDDNTHFAVIDSAGAVITSTILTINGGGVPGTSGFIPAHFSDGNTIIAGKGPSGIGYTILDSDYRQIAGSSWLPITAAGDSKLFVIGDTAGHAALVWRAGIDQYYANIDSHGGVVTRPRVLDNALPADVDGYAVTSCTWAPPEGVDGVAKLDNPDFIDRTRLRYANHGAALAAGCYSR